MRMRKKDEGFTLIELLVTIGILSLVAVVALVLVNNLTENASETKKLVNEKSVIAAGKEYTNEFNDILDWKSNNEETMACITVEEVIKQGFLNKHLLDDFVENDEEDYKDYDEYKGYSIKVIKSEANVNTYELLETNDCKIKDTKPPIIGEKPNGESNTNNPDLSMKMTSKEVEIKTDYDVFTDVEIKDEGTKVVKQKATLDGEEITNTKDLPLGKYKIVYYAEDERGNSTTNEREITIVDTGAPSIKELTQDPKSSISAWVSNTNGITLTGEASDSGSGIVAYKFTQNSNSNVGQWIELENSSNEIGQSQKVTENGTWYFYVKDAGDNVIRKEIEIFIDSIAPEYVSKNGYVGYNSIPTATYKDNQSGVKEVKYYVSTVSTAPENTNQMFSTNKSTSMSCYNRYYAWSIATDNAGNISKVTSLGDWYYDCWEDDDDDYYYEEEDTCDWLCQMEQNSEAWWEAETEEEKKTLEEANKELAEANGLNKEENFDDGQWKDENGDNLYEVTGGNKK